MFGFVSCCGGLCGFSGDSSLDGKFEGCFDFGFLTGFFFLGILLGSPLWWFAL